MVTVSAQLASTRPLAAEATLIVPVLGEDLED